MGWRTTDSLWCHWDGGVGATGKFGEGATHLGQALGKGVDGVGSTVSASMTKDAEMEKMDGEFKAMNSQNYNKNVNELSDKARQISDQMRSLVKELVTSFMDVSPQLYAININP